MKHFYGFSTMLGHGAMIKRDCYEKAGGFPPLVAEDLCLSIEARNAGYLVAFAPNIVCREEYPIDYVAFKKRHSKWTQGNLEFIKKYTGRIARSKMHWYEKMDIVLFTYNLPLTAVFAFFIFTNLMIAPLFRLDLGRIYALWMIIPTVIFFFSPMLNDFITWAFRLNPLRTLIYTLSVVVLYGSMLTTSLISATKGIFGKKARFIVTPKSSKDIGLLFALRFQWRELVFSTVLLAVSLIFQRGALPVALIVLTGYASIGLLFFSNLRYSEKKTEKIDRETEKISLEINQLFTYNQHREEVAGKKPRKVSNKEKNL
jgi:cellulose synthase/poly-beta-1,6-N-acetylglucosamine synthase-like glycosyltransferase